MLQRQIMFKQLEELQRQKKLQELNDSRQQNAIHQQSLIQNKQSSEAQYAPFINGTPVRDSSQMFMFGNTYSQLQNQVPHSFSRFSHFQGATRESTGEQVDMFGQVFSQGLETGGQAVNDPQQFGRNQEQRDLSKDFTSLDPLEQKFLFSNDDNSFGGFGSMFEDNDNSQSLPSLQSGSWSALMLSALDETSSNDTGIQEEWSGLSFQNPELSNDNQISNFMESGKHSTPWQNNVFQNVSSLSSRPENVKASSTFPGFQQREPIDGSAQVQRFSPLQGHQGQSGNCGEFEFVNDGLNNGREFKREFLPDNLRHSKASEVTTYRSGDCSGFPAIDSNIQSSRHMLELLHKVDKSGESRHGTQSASNESTPLTKMPKAETGDVFTTSNNSSAPQYFGLGLGPPTQRPSMNCFDSSQISQKTDTSHLVPMKNEEGHSQRSSIFETQQPPTSQQLSSSTSQPNNVWIDIPSHQSLPIGSPSTSDATNSRIETTSEPPNDFAMNSQNLDHKREKESKISLEEESFSGRTEPNSVRNLETFGHSLKQSHLSPHGYSPLNRTYSDPNTRTSLRNERVDFDTKVHQVTSMSQLTSMYENYKTLLTSSSAREDQLVKSLSIPVVKDVSSPVHRNSSFVQMNLASTSQYGSVWPVIGNNSFAVKQLVSPNQDLSVSKSRKRKFPTYEVLPWHKEATKGSSRHQDMSLAELEWAQAANRVPEKLKEEADTVGDLNWKVHSKKRISLTTQLMQVLFRPPLAAILSDDATLCYNTITYFAARFALGDACSLSNHSLMPSDSSSGKNVISKGSGDQNLSKIVEEFIDRSKKMEDELLRLENGGSILEIRMESQDLERFSVINRFAKFHSRAQMVAAESASSSSAAPKLYPQRYVTASPMPRLVPEGHNCLSL